MRRSHGAKPRAKTSDFYICFPYSIDSPEFVILRTTRNKLPVIDISWTSLVPNSCACVWRVAIWERAIKLGNSNRLYFGSRPDYRSSYKWSLQHTTHRTYRRHHCLTLLGAKISRTNCRSVGVHAIFLSLADENNRKYPELFSVDEK